MWMYTYTYIHTFIYFFLSLLAKGVGPARRKQCLAFPISPLIFSPPASLVQEAEHTGLVGFPAHMLVPGAEERRP